MSKSKSEPQKNPLPQSLLSRSVDSENVEMQTILSVMEKLLHWAAIIESSDDAIISKSNEGIITSWNKGAERLYGYTSKEIVGKPVSVLMPPEKGDDFPFIMKQLHEGKRIEHYETKRLTKDGKILNVSITVSPIKDSSGNIIGASKIARDITMRIENEKRREEFVSTASHELKTPITTQKAYGELLERMLTKDGDKKYITYVRRINQQTLKITKLIDDLLELSRFQSGTLKMESTEFDINALIKETINDLQTIIPQKISYKGIKSTKMYGDRDRIGQVLNNLLTNASKYSPGSHKIEVVSSKKDNYVVTSIKDYGIGIEREYFTRIFESFFRVSGDDEQTFPGMGIGLSFSREVIKRHKGDIWLESKKGEGSTFYFSLPIKK